MVMYGGTMATADPTADLMRKKTLSPLGTDPNAGGMGGGITSIIPPAPQPMQPSLPNTGITPNLPPPTQSGLPTLPGTTPFGPSNNLIGTQINPQPNADTTAARERYSSGLAGLGQLPDRQQIASNALKTFDEQQANALQLGTRDIGQNAAAAGRLGSGMVSTSLGDLQSQLNQQREQTLRGLSGDVASQGLNDRLMALGAQGQGLGQLSGLDTQQQNALRGERGYQAGLDQQGINNAFQQYGAEQGAQGQAFNQQQEMTRLLAQLGLGQGPNAQYGDVANQYAGQGADLQNSGADLLRLLFANKQPAMAGAGYASPYSD